MTQGRDGISLAYRAALRCLAVARQLSVVALLVSIAALVAGTAGTSYAKPDQHIEDTVVVTNFGSLFAGSIETFAAGSIATSKPIREVRGNATLLDITGASGDAQSSLDGDIAVTVPLGVAGLCPAGCVGVWPFGATGNTSPEDFIGGPGGTTPTSPGFPFFGLPLNNDHTGLFLDQGVAFANPFGGDGGVHSGPKSLSFGADHFAVANLGAIVFGSSSDFEFCGDTKEVPPDDVPPPLDDEDDEFTIGTISEFVSGESGNVFPIDSSFIFEAAFPPSTALFVSHATIGGCDTALFGPVGLAFDEFGDLWVVNEIGKFVSKFAPFAHGDAAPIDFVGLFGASKGAFVDPVYIAVSPDGDTIYVTDEGDNSIKIFDTSIPFDAIPTGTISGGHTKLFRPQGIALSGDDLYVAVSNNNSLLMFDDFTTAGGNIFPKTIIKGKSSHLNFPVGVALPQFAP